MNQKIYIKNMVCNRCVSSVDNTLNNLKIEFEYISLGQYNINNINDDLYLKLKTELQTSGFDLIDDIKKIISLKIKATLIDVISLGKIEDKSLLSILSENFDFSYNYLSKIFRISENITIEKYFLRLKIEKIKEYLSYNELSIKEISYKLNYNSVSHLSNHFKKETGVSPSLFKKNINKRTGLDF